MRRTAKQWQALINKQLQLVPSNSATGEALAQSELISPNADFIKLSTGSVNQQSHLTAGVQLDFRGARIMVPEHYSPIWVADLLKALMP